MRVVIADDSRLLREGIASLVRSEGIDVVALASDAEELIAAVDEHEPDVAIVDIRMPPTQTDEGIQAAHEIRRRHPGMGIVLLSQHVEVGVAIEIADDGLGGAETARGSGLRGLADRVEALDGQLLVTSPPGAGTVVTAELPCGS